MTNKCELRASLEDVRETISSPISLTVLKLGLRTKLADDLGKDFDGTTATAAILLTLDYMSYILGKVLDGTYAEFLDEDEEEDPADPAPAPEAEKEEAPEAASAETTEAADNPADDEGSDLSATELSEVLNQVVTGALLRALVNRLP